MWIAEGKMGEQEANRAIEGAPPRDVSSYSEWRNSADPENLDLLSLYGRFLVGQYAGMTEMLALPSVVAALEINGVPRDQWPTTAERLLCLHGLFEKNRPRKDGAR